MATLEEKWAEAVDGNRLPNQLSQYRKASNTTFDNTVLGVLASTNVQDAIDELTAASSQFTVILAGVTPAFSVFKLNAAGQAEIVTNTDPDLAIDEIVGMTLVAGVAGDVVDATKDKSIVDNPLWAFTPNANLFLDGAGQLTETPPIIGNYIPLGYAVSATKVWFQRGGQYRPEVLVLPVGVNVTAGMYVNIYLNAGVAQVRPAEATTALGVKKAHGFVLDTVASGNNVLVNLDGLNTGLAGLTIGQDYVLGSNGGILATTAPPALTGDIIQHIGVGVTASMLASNINSNYVVVP